MDRWHLAERIARESGLQYVYSQEYRRVSCHACGGVLLDKISWPNFTLCVTQDSRCAHCGSAVPIVPITPAEYAAIQAEAAAAGTLDVDLLRASAT